MPSPKILQQSKHPGMYSSFIDFINWSPDFNKEKVILFDEANGLVSSGKAILTRKEQDELGFY